MRMRDDTHQKEEGDGSGLECSLLQKKATADVAAQPSPPLLRVQAAPA